MKILVKRINRQVQVVRVGRRGLQGETGPQGQKGDQGDPATNLVQSVNGKQGVVVLNSTDVNADPTGSASTALTNAKSYTDTKSSQALQDAKDYTDTEVSTLDSSLATVAKTGSYSDLSNKPTIPSIAGLATEAQVQDVQDNLDAHTGNTSNPHNVTKAQVGLGNADNTSDANKPISTATQAALNAKANASDTVNLTGNQTVAGVKTFSSSPVVPTATTNTQAVNKGQMDTADALKVNKAGDTMTGRLGNATSNLASSNTRGGNEILYGATSVGNFGVLNNTNGIELFNAMADGSGIRLGTSTGLAILKGTGFPEGVVTAPTGSIYIDTAITNGASSWIKKSGTDNTGWVVSAGDTGWRNIGKITGLAEDLKIRRINNIIYLSQAGEAMTINSLATQTRLAIPLGFRSTMRSGFPLTTTLGDIKGSILVKSTEADIILTTNTAYQVFVAVAGAQWITNDAWPTTLPGVSA